MALTDENRGIGNRGLESRLCSQTSNHGNSIADIEFEVPKNIRILFHGWLFDFDEEYGPGEKKIVKASSQGSPREESLILGTIIHTTRGLSTENALKTVKEPRKGWHFTIGRDGKVFQHVALTHTANHAGSSRIVVSGKVERKLNRRFLGIELVNIGGVVMDDAGRYGLYIPPKGDRGSIDWNWHNRLVRLDLEKSGTLSVGDKTYPAYWQPFPSEQISSLNTLLESICEAGYPNATLYLVEHEEVAVPRGRKIDPGPLFPWHAITVDHVRASRT